MNWKELVKYPQLIYQMAPSVRSNLDICNELVPIEWDRDRIGTMLSWLRNCRETGLINSSEYMAIQQELINGCGGF